MWARGTHRRLPRVEKQLEKAEKEVRKLDQTDRAALTQFILEWYKRITWRLGR